MGGTLPPDPYEKSDRYVGTLTRANEPPQEAVAFLKFSPALWPFSLFSDDVSSEATIRTRSSTEYFQSLSAPNRVLDLRYGVQGLPANSPDISQSPVPLVEKGANSKVGEFGSGGISLRFGNILFEGRYDPSVVLRCGWRESHFSPRQYYYMSLPMIGAAIVGLVSGVLRARSHGTSISFGAVRGAVFGFLSLPVLLMLLLLVVLGLSLLVNVSSASFRYFGLI
jgi:hypothetical protein